MQFQAITGTLIAEFCKAAIGFMKIGSDIIKFVIVGIVILWLLGLIRIPLVEMTLFNIGGISFTGHHLLILILLGFAFRLLPGPLQWIAGILVIFWFLSTFIFPAFGGFANIFVLIIIIAILFSIF